MRVLIVGILSIVISGCASTYKVDHLTNATTKLSSGKMVIISTPENGFYEETNYTESGRMAAMVVNSAFARYSNSTVSSSCKDIECLRSIDTKYDYYIVPTILHWEDRATEWSGILDKVEVKISVYDRFDNKGISSTIINGKSKWFTMGGDHPQDLLPEPIGGYVDSLF